MNRRHLLVITCLVLAAAFLPLGLDHGSGLQWTAASAFVNSPSGGATGPAIKKFVNGLPGLGAAKANNLGEYLPVAIPDTTTYPGSDYYELSVGESNEPMHNAFKTLGGTRFRGYTQTNTTDPTVANVFHILGPIIIAQQNRPVRIKLTNALTANSSFFLPVDVTLMGAGPGPNTLANVNCATIPQTENPKCYSVNRALLHLHGGNTPWISDGTPHQWITPPGENTIYPKGVGFQNVPDMIGAGKSIPTPSATDGMGTYFYTNQQSGRFMFFHDHSYGMTRLNIYAGEVGGYIIHDPVEDNLIATGIIPGKGLGNYKWGTPLIIQDKTFVPANIAAQDPDIPQPGMNPNPAGPGWMSLFPTSKTGDLWFPHVYEPNQNPAAANGVNPMGRWDYGPWTWPPALAQKTPLPSPSIVPEAFMDTPVVNGTAYPFLIVQPKAYRFRILNGSNDRMWNLQLYYAATAPAAGSPPFTPGTVCKGAAAAASLCTEVNMVPANGAAYPVPSTFVNWPLTSVWVPFDGRPSGVPDPSTAGPAIIQIGNEGGLLPAPVVLNQTPIDYDYDRRSITMTNVRNYPVSNPPGCPTCIFPNPGYTLFVAPAERADIIVDFSQVPSGSTVMLYNDGPAPVPGFDVRYDYYTGDPDLTAMGGAPSTKPGFGPNTRTIMQFRVSGTPAAPFNLGALQAALPTAFAQDQPQPYMPNPCDPSTAAGLQYCGTNQLTTGSWFCWPNGSFVTPSVAGTTPTCPAGQTPIPVYLKTIAEDFDFVYGRMNAELGTEQSSINSQGQQTFGFPYIHPATEIVPPTKPVPVGQPNQPTQIWMVVHNGVDTHSIHVHLSNMQLINRVDWVGVIKPPDDNEKGWKETFKMNPLENIVLAVREDLPQLPFKIPNSLRPMDVTMPVSTTNPVYNLGNEYVWHCHILGHEENDMMRPLVVANAVTINVPPAPTNLVAVVAPGGAAVNLTWKDNSNNEQGFQIMRKTGAGAFVSLGTVGKNVTAFSDATVAAATTYSYEVIAYNASGSSAPSNVATVTTP